MNTDTSQIKFWKGSFGKEYTDRNIYNPVELDEMYRKWFGVTRTEMNIEFIGNLDKSIRILEVGSNVGNQLLVLQKMGFKNLSGIEIQDYAAELSKSRAKNINIIQVSGFEIPFKDGFFDIVFTSGVLIHIHPADIIKIIGEMHRCSKKYIWCFEYFSEEHKEIEYRGNKQVLWKGNFAKIFLDNFSDLKLVKEVRYKYKDSDNVDSMFLLEKAE